MLSDFLNQHEEQKQKSLDHLNGYNQILQLFTQVYFEDRLSLLHSISSLLRLSQPNDESVQQQHPYTSIVADAVKNLNDSKTNKDFPGRLFGQFTKLVRTCVPSTFATSTQLSQVYSQQVLKEEKALLEILVVYYISRPCPASRVLSIFQEFEANGFGTEQSIVSSLNTTGRIMCAEVSYLCGLFSVQLIQQATVMDATGNFDGLKSSPETIVTLNYLMTFLGDIKEQTLPLLAWADFLQSLKPLVSNDKNQDNGISYGKVKSMLDGTLPSGTETPNNCLLSSKDRPKNVHTGRTSSSIPTSNRTPVIGYGANLFQKLTARAISLNAFDYIKLILSSSELCNGEDVNKLGYNNIIYELLYRFTCAVNLSCLNESVHSTVIQNFCLLFRSEPGLCGRFWSVDSSVFMDMGDIDERTVALSDLLLEPESGRFPRKFTDIIQLLVSVCGDPAIGLAEATYVQNVTRYLMPDGWHALVDKLVRFSNGNQDSIGLSDVVCILQLFSKVLSSSDSTIIADLMKHLELIRPSSVSTCPFLVSLLCDIVTCNSAVRDCSVEVLTKGIECLTALLPYYPTHIWSFIGQSPLFPCPLESDPLLTVNFSKAPTRTLGNRHPAQIDHVIVSVECEIGKYSILLALLNFISGLINDIQGHWWTIHSDDSNGQYKAEILSGYLHYLLSHVLPYYAGWRYKSVYDRYLIGSKMTAIFIDVDRFFKFNTPNSGGYNIDAVSTMSKVRANMLYRFLKDKYAIQFYLSPLLDVMSNGTWMAENLYSTDRTKEAYQAETLTKLTFVFVKSLLQQQIDSSNRATTRNPCSSHSGLLENTILNHRIGNNGKTDFLFRMAQLVRYRRPNRSWRKLDNLPGIPILATNIISLLSLSVSRWNAVPNFVQYLGDTDQAQSVIKSYLAIASDSSQPETLLTSVWQMISLLVETQPSLALLFMECGDAIMPSPKTAVKLLDQQHSSVKKSTTSATFTSSSAGVSDTQGGTGTTGSESAVRAAVDLLNEWQSLSIEKPTVLSNVLRFLTAFWQSAFDHYTMVQRTRSDNALWQALEMILFNPSNMDLTGWDLEKEQKQQQQHLRQLLNDVELDGTNVEKVLYRVESALAETNQSITRNCCMYLNRALIMRLVSFEIQLTAGSQVAQGIKLTTDTGVVGDKLPAGLRNLLFKMGESKKLEWMRLCFIKNGFDQSLARQVHEDSHQVLDSCSFISGSTDMTPLLLQMVTNVGFGDDINNGQGQGRQYGISYLYDFPLAVSRISSLYHNATHAQREHLRRQQQNSIGVDTVLVTPQVQAVRVIKQACMRFVSDVCVANFNWSLVDAEMMQLQSFKTVMETSSGHVPDVIWHTKTKSTLYPFINDLIDQVIKDDDETTTRQQEQEHNQQHGHDNDTIGSQDGVALTSHQNVVNLIRALTEDWISSKRTLIMDKSASQQQLKLSYIKEAVSLILKLCQLLERENFALKHSSNSPVSTVYHRPLLESILLCIRTVQTSSSNHEVSQLGVGGLREALTPLLHVICASFSGVVQNAMAQQRQQKTTAPVPDDKTEECIKDVTVVLALLGELIKSNKQRDNIIPVEIWLPIFEEYDTIPMLLKLAYHGMILVVDEMESQTKSDHSGLYNIMVSPYAENAMYFMIALSNIPQAAKSLQLCGVMDLLCNNALSSRLEQGKLDIFVRFGDKTASESKSHSQDSGTSIASGTNIVKPAATTAMHADQSHGLTTNSTVAELGIGGTGFVERHPLHVLWCQMLNVVSNMIRIVGVTEDAVLRHGVLFIQQYSGQVDRSFAIANGANDSLLGLVPSESMSSALMTEIEWLTTILFCLAKQLTRVASYAANIFMAFKNCGLPLIRRYLYHLTHPNHMQAQLFPVDQDEKYQSHVSINCWSSSASSSSPCFISPPSSHQQQQTASINNEHNTSQLMHLTTQRFIRITRNILGSIVLLTDAQTILVGRSNTWPFGNTILSPDTQTNSSSTVSFGIMKEWIMACLQLTQRTVSWISEHQHKQNSLSSASVSSTLSPPSPCLNDLRALLCTLEFSIVLLTSQTLLWIAKPDIQQDERKMIASDNLKSLVNLMDKMNTALKKLEPELQLASQIVIIDELKMVGTHVLAPLKHLLITRFFEPAQ
ncbi:hypothetical protein BCR42DRAFT_449374 [Absidia repens]|uniref:Nucleoporin Nup188 N-terminal subdomain III domain-containing protein n=1 Tax=Absidia repens TaxID=90262 RepID=A0A1X2INQ0_9FUNG|nr:hypothetical protein BCR42DRAFT_449374 [Absidia repens]